MVAVQIPKPNPQIVRPSPKTRRSLRDLLMAMAFVAVGAAAPGAVFARTIFIDFDDLGDGVVLNDQYNDRGVNFYGLAETIGFSNREFCEGLNRTRYLPRSCYNSVYSPHLDLLDIRSLDGTWSSVGAWFHNDVSTTGLYFPATLTAYNAAGDIVDSVSLVTEPGGEYAFRSVSGAGITRAQIEGAYGFWGFDDLTIQTESTAPEPGAWALMTAGFAAVGATLRRRRPVSVRAA